MIKFLSIYPSRITSFLSMALVLLSFATKAQTLPGITVAGVLKSNGYTENVCSGESLLFGIDTTNGNYGSNPSFTWARSSDTNFSDTNQALNLIFPNAGIDSVSVIVDTSGYDLDTFWVFVNTYNLVQAPELQKFGSNSSDTICYDTQPSQLDVSNGPLGGSGQYSYQWQFSKDATTFNDTLGSSNVFTTLQPNNLKDTTWYRLKVIDAVCGDSVFSDTLKINVLPQLTFGNGTDTLTSNATNDTVCFNDSVSLTIQNYQYGDGSYTIYWQIDNGGSWVDIATSTTNSTSGSLTPSFTLTQDTTFQVIVTDGCGDSITSNSLTIHVRDSLQAPVLKKFGSNNSSDTTICYNTHPSQLDTSNGPSGGSSQYSYQWQDSTSSSSSFSDITGATSSSFQPNSLTVTTWYRLKVTDTVCGDSVYSDTLQVNVLSEILPNLDFILGPAEACKGAKGLIYNLPLGSLKGQEPIWSLSASGQGTLLATGWTMAIINLNSTSSNPDTITATIKDTNNASRIECIKTPLQKIIEKNSDNAPNPGNITQHGTQGNLSNILVSSVATADAYRWGWIDKNAKTINYLHQDSNGLQYAEFNTINTASNIYFVEIWSGSCYSRAFFNNFNAFTLQERKQFEPFSVYPNPATKSIRFAGPIEKIAALQLIDLYGKIYPLNHDQDGQVMLSPSLPAGTYILRIVTPQHVQNIRFILVR